jgi:hypothetical protein
VRGGRLARLARLVRWTTVLAGGVLTAVVVLEAERRQPGPMLLVALTHAALTASLVVMTGAGVLALGVLASFAVAVRRMAAGPAS